VRVEEHPRALVYHRMEASQPIITVLPRPPRYQVEERHYMVERPSIPKHRDARLGQDFKRQQGS
jgi:hypothetical protein